jgi:hypothetical protein
MFNSPPSHDDRSLRVQLQAVQSTAPRRLFAITPQASQSAGAEGVNSPRDKNDDRIVAIGRGIQNAGGD